MNEARVRKALDDFSVATEELATMCDLEAPEYGPVWHAVARNAKALRAQLNREDLDDLIRGAASMFAYHPGSFSEVYVARTDLEEQRAANDKFDALKDQVSKLLAELRSVATDSDATAKS